MRRRVSLAVCMAWMSVTSSAHARTTDVSDTSLVDRLVIQYQQTGRTARDERLAILQELGEMRERAAPAVRFLIELLQKPDPQARTYWKPVRETLLRIGDPAVPVLLYWMRVEPSSVRPYHLARELLLQVGPPAIPQLIDLLSDTNPRTRRRAVMILGEMGEPATVIIPELAKLLNDTEGRVSDHVSEALGRIGEASIPLLMEKMKDTDLQNRIGALAAFEWMGPEAKPVMPYLLAAMNDSSFGVRMSAIFALAATGEVDHVVAPILLDLLMDSGIFQSEGREHLWERAARALSRTGVNDSTIVCRINALTDGRDLVWGQANATDLAVTIFTWGMKYPLPNIRRVGINGFQTFEKTVAKSATPDLLTALEDISPAVRSAASDVLFFHVVGDRRDTEALSILMRLMAIGSDEESIRVAFRVEQFGETAVSAAPILLERLHRVNPGHRSIHIIWRSIEKIRGPSIDLLMPMLQDDDTVCLTTIHILGELDARGWVALPELERLMGRGDSVLSTAAARVVNQITNALERTSNLGAWEAMLKRPSDALRIKASQVLKKYGATALSAVPSLVVALEDTHPTVRLNMAFALIGMDTYLPQSEAVIIHSLRTGSNDVRLAYLQEFENLVVQMTERPRALNLQTWSKITVDVMTCLTDSHPKVRLLAARTLIWMDTGVEAALSALVEIVESVPALERRAAMEVLGMKEKHFRPAETTFVGALTDTDWKIREIAAVALLRFGLNTDSALMVLLDHVVDKGLDVGQSAVRRLMKPGVVHSHTIPYRILNQYWERYDPPPEYEGEPGWCGMARCYQYYISPDSALPDLYREMEGTDPSRRRKAAKAIAKFRRLWRVSAVRMVRALADEDTTVRCTAAEYLLHRRDATELELRRTLNDKRARPHAAAILGQWDTLQPLYHLFITDPDFSAVYCKGPELVPDGGPPPPQDWEYSLSEKKLWRIIGESENGGVGWIIRAARNDRTDVRQVAIEALAAIGGAGDTRAIRALEELSKTAPNPDARAGAAERLKYLMKNGR